MKLDYFEELWANQDEVITHSYVQDVRLPSGKDSCPAYFG
jgi:hypothetical protein